MAVEFAQTESPAERYRRLAQECMTTAADLPFGEQREVLLQMGQVWQRLAEHHIGATTSLTQPSTGEQPAMQQQQQVQPKDRREEGLGRPASIGAPHVFDWKGHA